MDFVPIMLNVSDVRVVVFGGGEAAFKKVRNLAQHCRQISVVSSEFHPEFKALNADFIKTEITDAGIVEKHARKGDMAIIATDDGALNTALAARCRDLGILYNRIDDDSSPFIFPASFETGGVVVSVSTLGKSPSFARYLSEQLKVQVSGYIKALPVIETLRIETREKDFHLRSEYFWKLLHEKDFWKFIDEGDEKGAYSFGVRYRGNFW